MAKHKKIVDQLKAAAILMDLILEDVVGLSELDRKIVVYYTMATHALEFVDTFPLLVLEGPPGTGKSTTLHVIEGFAFRPWPFSIRNATDPVIRDELAASHNGTAIIEESDEAWRGSTFLEGMLSVRYQRASGKVSLKIPNKSGRGYHTQIKPCFGASVLHRRVPFKDAALDGRSVIIHFKPKTGDYYAVEDVQDILDSTSKKYGDFVFELPDIENIKGVAGRILSTNKPILSVATMCGDLEFLEAIQERLKRDSELLSEAQSIDPAGLVVRAVMDCLTDSEGKLVFRAIKTKDLRDSIRTNCDVELTTRQVGVLAQQFGFEKKESHGYPVVVPSPEVLLKVCAEVGYEDEAIKALGRNLRRGRRAGRPG